MSTAETTISIVVLPDDPAVEPLLEDVSVEAIAVLTESAFESDLFAERAIAVLTESAAESDGLSEAENAVLTETTSETDTGGGGASKTVVNVNVTGDLIQVTDYLWPSLTVVRWSTTGTLPSASPALTTSEDYYLIEYVDPEYVMYRSSDDAEISFITAGTGTHTLTEQP